MKIGMFDSGIGGLTVLHTAIKMLPQEAYFYYADTDHVPYGTKSVEEIRRYSEDAVAFLESQGCDAVVSRVIQLPLLQQRIYEKNSPSL